MTPAMLGSGAAVAWFAAFVAVQVAIPHVRPAADRGRLLVLCYGLCGLGLASTVVACVDTTGWAVGALFGLLTMSCLFVLYTPLYYVVSNSVSVRSMVFLLHHGGRLPETSLYRRFAGPEFLDARLDVLARNGYIVRDGTTFRITPRGQIVVAPFRFLQALWRLDETG
jgi:hypothetical protein